MRCEGVIRTMAKASQLEAEHNFDIELMLVVGIYEFSLTLVMLT